MSTKIKNWFSKYKYSIFYYLSAVFVVLSWFVFDFGKTVKIIFSLLFVVTMGLYNIQEFKKKTSLFNRFVEWFNFSIFLIFTVIFIALSVGEVNIAVIITLFAFFLMLISVGIFCLIVLFKAKENLIGIIILSVTISFLIIISFGYIYLLTPSFSESNLIFTNSNKTLGIPWDYVYFSSSAFYGNAVGDIQPIGYNKLIMQIESAISFIFHIIILGALVSVVSKKLSIGKN